MRNRFAGCLLVISVMILVIINITPVCALDDGPPRSFNSRGITSVPTEEEERGVITAIQSSDLTVKEQEELIKTLKEIWASQPRVLKKKQQMALEKAAQIVIDYYQIDIPNENPDVVGWQGNPLEYAHTPHNDLAEIAGKKMGLSTSYTDILNVQASVPDMAPLWERTRHFYDYGAAGEVDKNAQQARNLIRSGKKESGYQKLAWAMHFMDDLSNPYHTTHFWSQIHHSQYEHYVSDNWVSGIQYQSTLTNSPSYWYYYVSDPLLNAMNNAKVTNKYFDYIDNQISKNPNWKNDPTVIRYTKECLINALRYNEGLIKYSLN